MELQNETFSSQLIRTKTLKDPFNDQNFQSKKKKIKFSFEMKASERD